ncbi:MAG: ERCC4 domain-containing protein [Nitrososphaeraceae archaeon]
MGVRIVIDEREKGSRVPELLRGLGASIEFSLLAVGDYIVSSQTAIERKTISDLISSIYDGRLFLQCNDLIQYYSKPLIVIEGNALLQGHEQYPYSQTRDDDSRESYIEQMPLIFDALAKVALEFRIPIIPAPTPECTSRILMIVANLVRMEGSPDGPLLRRIRKQNPFYIQQLSVLSSLPGVGDKTAIRMLKKFNTPIRTLTASVAELSMIAGLGTNRAIRIRRLLDYSSPTKDVQNEIQKTLGDTDESLGEQLK